MGIQSFQMLPVDDNERQAKLVVLGSKSVGKTALARRVIDDVFDPAYEVTIAVSYRVFQKNISGQAVSLQIWETGGMERHYAIGPIYYHGSHAAVFVYDVTEAGSAAEIASWYKTFTNTIGDRFFGVVVANKMDLCGNRERLRICSSLRKNWRERAGTFRNGDSGRVSD
jgi:small GTP-binding protein